MITEDYVSYEIAKLLKEKGFYQDFYNSFMPVWHYNGNNKVLSFTEDDSYPSETQEWYSAPTLQMAMKWLREKQIFITIGFCDYPTLHKSEWIPEVCTHDSIFDEPSIAYSTYEEACEAAIKYCLNNLIKNEDKEEEPGIPVPKTVNEAISTLEKILSDEDREYLLKNGAISMHHSLGRWIRNEWGLWTGSELKDELMNMNKGLNHPDDMSNYIIEEFIKYLNNKI